MSIKEPPCKIGDRIRATVISPYNGHEAFIHGEVIKIDQFREVVKVVYNLCRTIEFYYDDFGKTVFVERNVIEMSTVTLRICCNCKKESLLMPYVCPDCLRQLKAPQIENEELKTEIKRLRELLNKASQILQDNAFEEESKAIDCMAEL